MVASQRAFIADDIRTNGATPNPWWANAVVYQIYPRSFRDSNGDGFGDLRGIESRLDYLADLGVDVVWLSPVYRSPQDDNGYDISDYQDIDPMFGTLEDMDRLIAAVHQRGMKLVMDLVVNHTSDEHAWFQASRHAGDPHADWYWWRPARAGHEPGTPGAEPNRWGSYFGGSAWQYDAQRGEYFLHQFSAKQPDLNWENPELRRAVYAMMNWWMDRGIDGFRMDVIVLISKMLDAEGRLPGEAGSGIADGPVLEDGYSSPSPFCTDGPRLDEYLREMRREVFAARSGYLTVGEAPGLSDVRNGYISDPAHQELDMLFLFDHVGIDQDGSKWNPTPFEPAKLRTVMMRQQAALRQAGWASLYMDNHDQPRVVSRWGDTSTEALRSRSAKALALMLHLHRGTPYIYQGEELGMTNAGFTELGQYRDLESINMYHQLVDEAKVQTPQSMLHAIARMGRDNARTPMQWDGSRYAGFTAPDAPTEPWIAVNPNHVDINVAAEFDDPDSVYAFYKRLIALRHTDAVVAAGVWDAIDVEDPAVYAFTRTVARADGAESKLLVVANLTSRVANMPHDSRSLLAETATQPGAEGDGESSCAGFEASKLVISTVSEARTLSSMHDGGLLPWEAFVYRLS